MVNYIYIYLQGEIKGRIFNNAVVASSMAAINMASVTGMSAACCQMIGFSIMQLATNLRYMIRPIMSFNRAPKARVYFEAFFF